MNRRKTRFSENGSGIFFARHLDSKRRIEIAREIRRSAQAFACLFVAFAHVRKDQITQVICPTCRIGHSAGSQDSEDAIEDATVVHPRARRATRPGSIGLMAAHSSMSS
jgi:hypothetical protein